MILIPHILVGAAIGSRFKKYWVILILSIASHFFLDSLPHWDYILILSHISYFKFLIAIEKPIIDASIGFIMVIFLFRSSPLLKYAFIGAIAGAIPDCLTLFYFALQTFAHWKSSILASFFAFHQQIQFAKNDNSLAIRIFMETLVAIIAVIFANAQIIKDVKQKNKKSPENAG